MSISDLSSRELEQLKNETSLLHERIGHLSSRQVSNFTTRELVELKSIKGEASIIFESLKGLDSSRLSKRETRVLKEIHQKLSSINKKAETITTQTLDEIHKTTKLKLKNLKSASKTDITAVYEVSTVFLRDLERMQMPSTPQLESLKKVLQEAIEESFHLITHFPEGLSAHRARNLFRSDDYSQKHLLEQWIKETEETKAVVKKQPVYGPKQKTEETVRMQEILSLLLADESGKITFKEIPEGGTVFVEYNGHSYNLSEMLSKVDFNQIVFTDTELDKYVAFLNKDEALFKPQFDLKPFLDGAQYEGKDPKGLYKNLHLAEKHAINIYTGAANWFMILLLRGSSASKLREGYGNKPIDMIVKEGLLHSAVAISGLSKIPDFTGPDGAPPPYLLRTDPHWDYWSTCVKEGGSTVMQHFLSTAYGVAVEIASKANSFILIKDACGKDVKGLSQSPMENEALIPPTPLQFLYERTVEMQKPRAGFPSTLHFLIAKVVPHSPQENPVQ